MKKLIISIITTLLPLLASADAVEINGIYYNLDNEEMTAEVTSNPDGYTGNIEIPMAVEPKEGTTYDVTTIGARAFYGCSNLASIIIPNSVTIIGDNAFFYCSGLTSVTIPNSVTTIGGFTFYGCSGLTSVTIGNSVTSIGDSGFRYCSGLSSIVVESGNTVYDSRDNCNAIINTANNELIAGCRNTVIPNSVTSIGNYAFEDCWGLTSVTIPNSVTSIGIYAFYGCSGLTEVISLIEEPFEINNIVFSSWNSITRLYDFTTATLYVPAGCKEKYESTPAWNKFDNIIEIGGSSNNIVFADPTVKAICVQNWDTNDDGELSYGEAAAVTDLGDAFNNNSIITSFDELQYFTGLTSICNNAFFCCLGLTSVTIPNNVTSIGDYAFGGCWRLSVTIPNSVTSIGDYAFDRCWGLTSVTIPNSVKSIGAPAFRYCIGLTSIVVERGNTVYDSRDNCNAIIKTATNELIDGCINTVIPNSVTSIGEYAFYYCSGLTSVTIPNSVTSIGDEAFFGCNSLTEVISLIEEPFEINENVFDYIDFTSAKLYVPAGCKEKYESTPAWNKFENIIEIGGSGTAITTGIDVNNRETINSNRYYNLNGQRVEKPTNGIYIHDGKKIVIK